MNQGMICCIRKDIKECMRTGKVILFAGMVLGIGVMIMGFTLVFSDIPEELWAQLPGFNIESLEELVSTMYPKMVRESVGIFSYYIGFFFSLVVILVIHAMLPKEEKNAKWILPMEQGYSKTDFLMGKCIVYGSLAGGMVLIGYLAYYFLACCCMEQNMPFSNALVCGIVHGLNLFFIVAYTMMFSMLLKNPVVSAVSMIATIILVPDMTAYFSIGKILPTHLLRFVYDSSNSYGELFVPMLLNITFLVILWILIARKEGMQE
ncbi:MAG: hypothetical protein K6E75_01140 [Lachnospiraceae bacterium]|nr:hypothetical protein [Lachnospiraceae bacterium]